ncbi:deoxyribose-phosphate aldolase [Flavilitoribacter nigricans]|uniref:Deoxyribose-phosphate aldolase n=1 Tax=Flavilitoribacter nigricans (strain ATCC 23147 / DSM 23189 / NBRC 102662 / NCIMB 1420 / SS-2) TaxID=1122177 RepID=A0A2D0NIG4_FLAN2|nr:deoxyribose-phosphate aldolase [Flavilitoribacter nigricans]PHN07543.1 deoxyribose-phosphate aldolase [Flavilitoribacter nigricans DSM 23189 = NBRC 102662]
MDPVTELAKMIDHSLLHPTMTREDLEEGCAIARKYNVASVCIKPYAVEDAVRWLAGSDVLVGTVIGFPHGNSTTEIKVAEAEKACRDGATEIDMVVNIGKVLGEDWAFVEQEIEAVTKVCHAHGAIVKVIFENDFLPEDKYKIRLCEICSKVQADFVKTSTGYGMVKGSDGKYSYQGATESDLKLMRKHSAPGVQVKAAGGVRTLEDLLKVKDLGVTRVGATATIAMLEAAKKKYGVASDVDPSAIGKDTSGY